MKFIPPNRHHDKPDDPDFFVIKDASGIAAARHWLARRMFNTYVHSIDRNGSLLIGLIYDHDLGTFPSQRRHKRGIICVGNQLFEKPTIKLVLSHMIADVPYARAWKEKQVLNLKNRGTNVSIIHTDNGSSRILRSEKR